MSSSLRDKSDVDSIAESAKKSELKKGQRKIFIQKSETGFGFNVRGQVSEGGPLKIYNGEFYAPLQQVSAVLQNGAAEKAGLCKGDRILEVNGINVDGATHKQVVDLIKSGGDSLTLVVLAMPSDETTIRYDSTAHPTPNTNTTNNNNTCNSDDSSCNSYDYSERRPLPVTIPDFTELRNSEGDKYVVFNVWLGGRHLCSRRYREFDVFHALVKREFPDFTFPHMPSKWPFKLSYQQLDARRRSLETYLDKICSVKIIFDSEIVRDFLCISSNTFIGGFTENDHQNENNQNGGSTTTSTTTAATTAKNGIDSNATSPAYPKNSVLYRKKITTNYSLHDDSQSGGDLETSGESKDKSKQQPSESDLLELKVTLPDKSVSSVNVKQSANTDEVYAALVEAIDLDPSLSQYFYLFEAIDNSFERKLRPNEQPYLINAQNLHNSSSSSGGSKMSTCIRMKKWYFSLKTESLLAKNAQTLKYLFHQAVEDFEREQIKMPDNYPIDLNFFKENSRYLDYLKHVYKFEGYGELVFPHCPCDSRKNGHVVVVIGASGFKLAACTREGELESQVVEFAYEDIEKTGLDDEEMAFSIEVKLANKPNKVIKIYTGFYLYMNDCVKKAKEERISKQDNKENDKKSSE